MCVRENWNRENVDNSNNDDRDDVDDDGKRRKEKKNVYCAADVVFLPCFS